MIPKSGTRAELIIYCASILDLGNEFKRYERQSRVAYWNGKNALGEPVASGIYFSVAIKRACQKTHSTDGLRPWINHLKTLEVCRCDQVWIGDITHVRLKGHFIYLALLMDVFTRMIRGWKLSQHLTQSPTLNSLREALRQSVLEIHHSDQGMQYLSNTYLLMLRRHVIEISVAPRGCPWENGYAERLIHTLKEEEVHLNDYHDIHEARDRISHFITQVYHHKRPHSALGDLTPLEFQRQNLS